MLTRKRDTLAGGDGVTYYMLAHAGLGGEEAVLALINCSWMAGSLLSARKAAKNQPISKPRESAKPRPISLMSYRAKTEEGMVLSRLQWLLRPLHPHTFSGSPEDWPS